MPARLIKGVMALYLSVDRCRRAREVRWDDTMQRAYRLCLDLGSTMGLCQSQDAASVQASSPPLLFRSTPLASKNSITVIPDVEEDDEAEVLDVVSAKAKQVVGMEILSPACTEATNDSTVTPFLRVDADEDDDDDEGDIDVIVETPLATLPPLHSIVESAWHEDSTIPSEIDQTIPSDEEDSIIEPDYEEPGRLVISKLQSRLQTNLLAPPRPVTPNAPPVTFSPCNSSAVHPQTISAFARLKLQQQLQQQHTSKQATLKKYQDRYTDVQGYRKLWTDYQKLQHDLKKKGKEELKKEPNVTQEEPTPLQDVQNLTRTRSQSFDLKDSKNWFFNFNDVDFAFEGPQSRQAMSLLSASSMEAQRRLFQEKRRRRKKSSRLSASSRSCTSDYGPVTPNEVLFDEGDTVSELGDDASVANRSYTFNDYRVARRSYCPPSQHDKLSLLEERIRSLKSNQKETPVTEMPREELKLVALVTSPLTASQLADRFDRADTSSVVTTDARPESPISLGPVLPGSPPRVSSSTSHGFILSPLVEVSSPEGSSSPESSILKDVSPQVFKQLSDAGPSPSSSGMPHGLDHLVASPTAISLCSDEDEVETMRDHSLRNVDPPGMATETSATGGIDAPGERFSEEVYAEASLSRPLVQSLSPVRIRSKSPTHRVAPQSAWIANLSTQEFLRLAEENALERAARLEHNEEPTESHWSEERSPPRGVVVSPDAPGVVVQGSDDLTPSRCLDLAESVESQVQHVLSKYRQSLTTRETSAEVTD